MTFRSTASARYRRSLANASAAKPTVLVVDDNAGDAILIEIAMGEVGFDCTVIRVDNALQAYAVLLGAPPWHQRMLPDLILLDLDLPNITGVQFLRGLRASPVWRDLAVLVFSGSTCAAEIAEVLQLGALRCLAKPAVWAKYTEAALTIRDAWHDRGDAPETRLVAVAERSR